MEEILKEISNSIISQLGLGGLIVVIIVILLIRYLHQKLRADIFKEIYSITNKKDDDKELKKNKSYLIEENNSELDNTFLTNFVDEYFNDSNKVQKYTTEINMKMFKIYDRQNQKQGTIIIIHDNFNSKVG